MSRKLPSLSGTVLRYYIQTGSSSSSQISGNNQFAGKSTFKKRDTSLPPTKPNGQLVSSWKPDNDRNYTVYRYEGHQLRADNTNQPKIRQQSLPPRKPQVEDDAFRVTLSAPQNDGPQGPLPKINNYVIKDHAGVSTQVHDQGYPRTFRSKSNKFATSWANARVENSTVVNGSEVQKKTHRDQHDAETNKQSKEKKPAVSNTPEVDKHPEGSDKLHHGKDQHNQQSQKEKEKTVDIFHASPSNKGHGTSHVTSHVSSSVSPYTQRKVKTLPRKASPTETHKPKSTPVVSPDSEIDNNPKTQKKTWRTDFRKADPAPHVPERERRRQERELTYKPATTDSKTIYKAYTGIIKNPVKKHEDRSKSSHSDSDLYRQKTNVHSEKEHVLNQRETHSWIKIHSVYGSEKFKKQRKQCFIEKLSKVEADIIKQKQIEIQEKERKKNESKLRQHRQLMFVRKRFQQQQWRRFRSQYVTSRVLEHELTNRHKYGLPENYGEDKEVQNSAKLRRKKKPNITQFDEDKAKQKYEKKFKQMFDINAGPTWDPNGKTPKMEGIDIVVVDVHDDKGNVKQQKKDVTKIVKEAENAIKSDNDAVDKNKSHLTPRYRRSRSRSNSRGRSRVASESKSRSQSRGRVSLDSLDLDDDDDDDDIFEKARKKYNLSVDDEDDDDLGR